MGGALAKSENIVLPFLKWPGGKRWLVARHPELFPKVKGRHIEPFAGSSAAFFHLAPQKAVLSDTNPRLIECYEAIKENPILFNRYLGAFAAMHSKRFYYQERQRSYRSKFRRAAQFVYFNRVCFNGIYRENLAGWFNVPLGSKTNILLETDDFTATATVLRRATLLCSDFETVIDSSGKDDFIFIDPPYTTKHNVNGFVKYNQKIFSWDDQIRLASAVARATKRGVRILVANADHEEVRNLYRGILDIRSIARANVIASKSKHRGEITEMVASNAS